MVLCFRCQRNVAQFECEICNGLYCSECDKFIHSNKPKNNHIRKQIQVFEQKENPINISASPFNNLEQNQNSDKINFFGSTNINWNNNSDNVDNKENNKSLRSLSISQKEIVPENGNQLLSQTYQQPPNNMISNIDIKENEKEKENKTTIKEDINEEDKRKNIDNPPIDNLNNCILNKNNNYQI